MNNPVEYLAGADPSIPGYSEEGWYFWEETWTSVYGPYDTRVYAETAMRAYAKQLHTESKDDTGNDSIG